VRYGGPSDLVAETPQPSEGRIVNVCDQIAIAEIIMHKSNVESGLILTEARALLRNTAIGCLATLQNAGGGPYASLITIATAADGSPVFLISSLAWHTRNLQTDSRASILISEAAATGDPLDVGRVSLLGIAEKIEAPTASRRFLARHPTASGYAGFADFSFWRLQVETAHYVGGFGRITTLAGTELLLDCAEAQLWEAGSGEILEQLNARYSDLIGRLAALRRPDLQGVWRIAACDPLGCDLVLGEAGLRLVFAAPPAAPDGVADALAALAANEGVN
jgi:putative heme iron utilization protein